MSRFSVGCRVLHGREPRLGIGEIVAIVRAPFTIRGGPRYTVQFSLNRRRHNVAEADLRLAEQQPIPAGAALREPIDAGLQSGGSLRFPPGGGVEIVPDDFGGNVVPFRRPALRVVGGTDEGDAA